MGRPNIVIKRLPLPLISTPTMPLISDKVTDDLEGTGKIDDIQASSNSLRCWRFPLPTELILEVVLHFSAEDSITDDHEEYYGLFSSNGLREEQATLRALSQTSHMLRNVCLPLLWRRVRVVPGPGPDWHKSIHTRLEQITTGLIYNSSLAAFVRFVLEYFGTKCKAIDYLLQNFRRLH